MLPTIRRHARFAFQYLRGDDLDDAVTEVVANSLVAFVRLFKLGKTDLAYPTVLARFGVFQVRSGRRVGNRLAGRDVLSPHAQRRHGFTVEQLDQDDAEGSDWRQLVVEDRRSSPADIAATRIDFSDWLAVLPDRKRHVAEYLAIGETTSDAARKFGVSAARISQLRRELHDSWRQFHGGNGRSTSTITPFEGKEMSTWVHAEN
jgi:hypothetical protein